MRSFLLKVSSIVLGVVWFVCNSSYAQVPVALPTEFFSARDVALSVTVGDVSGYDVKAFLLTVTYDDTIFEITGVDSQGDLAEDFSIVLNTDVPGQVTIGGAHFNAASGEGVLMHLTGRFVKKGTTNLVFNSFTFNEGLPLAATNNGEISNTIQVSNEDESFLPQTFELRGNYPNPFNPTTSIQFDLPETAEVTIEVVDMLGRIAMTIPSRIYQAGANQRIDVDASSLASGIYVYQVVAQGINKTFVKTSTMTLIK